MLKDKIIIVTGAGSGLGRQLAASLVDHGASVIGFGRSIEKLEAIAQSLSESDRFTALKVDVSEFEEVQRAVAIVTEKFGRIDIVFNNAAVYPKANFVDELASDFASAVAINVCGIANVCKAVIPVMRQTGKGRLINLGSWAHLGPIENSAVYSCTKGAVHSLCKAIAADIAAKDLNIETLEWIPGHLNTQMSEFTGMDPKIAAAWGAEIAAKPPLGKHHAIFEQNWEWQPPLGLKAKIKRKVFFWK